MHRPRFTRYVSLAILLLVSLLSAQSSAADDKRFIVLEPVKAAKSLKGFDKLQTFAKAFLERDSRVAVQTAPDDKTTHFLSVQAKKSGRQILLTVTGKNKGGEKADVTAKLSARPGQAEVEAQFAKAVRLLFDYKPARTKALVRILAKAAQGEADGGVVQDKIERTLAAEYEFVSADPYKLPVTDKDVPFLYKGDKGRLKKLLEGGGAELLVTGTVDIPKAKNVGSATEVRFKGKARAKIRVWDVKNHRRLSDLDLTLNAEGIFSELIYLLLEGAGDQTSKRIAADLGFPTEEEIKTFNAE